MVSRWAVIQDGIVTNVVLWDGDPDTWQPPADAQLVPYDPSTHTLAQPVAMQNERTLHEQALTALATNRTYLGLGSPSALQTTAEVKALARQVNGLIRLVLQQLDGTD